MALNKVQWRGGTFSAEFAHALMEANRLLPTIPLIPTQGGFNGTRVKASAGTHAGDAVDISVRGLSKVQRAEIVRVLRMVGIAAWERFTWQGFEVDHIHGVPNMWGYPSAGAAAQAVSYRAGRNGLRGNGADNATRAYVRQTWGGYLKATGRLVAADGTTYVPKSVPEVRAAATSSKRKAVEPTGIYALGQGRAISYAATMGASVQNRKYLQQILAAQKKPDGKPYYAGPVDGVFGPMWDKALYDWRVAVYKTTNAHIVSGKMGWSSFKRLVEWAGFRAVK